VAANGRFGIKKGSSRGGPRTIVALESSGGMVVMGAANDSDHQDGSCLPFPGRAANLPAASGGHEKSGPLSCGWKAVNRVLGCRETFRSAFQETSVVKQPRARRTDVVPQLFLAASRLGISYSGYLNFIIFITPYTLILLDGINSTCCWFPMVEFKKIPYHYLASCSTKQTRKVTLSPIVRDRHPAQNSCQKLDKYRI